MNDLYIYERKLIEEGFKFIAGTDEAGRGPMAGPLVAAAVILNPQKRIIGLNDSKKLSKKQRDYLYQEILQHALAVSCEFIDSQLLDKINIYQATKLAMKRAIESLSIQADYILSDAMPLDVTIPYEKIIKGDAKSASIAAASIVAKVRRDMYMIELQEKFPQYSFARHKGYVTKAHLQEISLYGLIDEHRRSFSPVQEVLRKQ